MKWVTNPKMSLISARWTSLMTSADKYIIHHTSEAWSEWKRTLNYRWPCIYIEREVDFLEPSSRARTYAVFLAMHSVTRKHCLWKLEPALTSAQVKWYKDLFKIASTKRLCTSAHLYEIIRTLSLIASFPKSTTLIRMATGVSARTKETTRVGSLKSP